MHQIPTQIHKRRPNAITTNLTYDAQYLIVVQVQYVPSQLNLLCHFEARAYLPSLLEMDRQEGLGMLRCVS